MKLMHSNNVYSFVLTELEWYLATEQEREAWITQVKREGEAAGCQYMSLSVEPDAIMSVSPIARRHTVWRYAVPTSAEENFCGSLLAVLDLHRAHLTPLRMAALAKEVFKS